MGRRFASVEGPGEVVAKILLADDSGTAQRMGAQILSAEGHEVATVSNGQAAIKMLAKFAPDLIVADVFMPGKTGYELCELVKSDPDSAWIPVLLIVAPMEPYDATEGKRVKADGLVTKPLDKSNLVETVQSLLASCKRPAPASKKRGAKAAAAAPEPEPSPPPEPAKMHDLPAEEDPTIPAISSTAALEIEIPEEMRNQPVSLVGELLEPESPPPEPSAPEPSAQEEFVIERSGGESSPLEVEPDNQLEVEQDSELEIEPAGLNEATLEPVSPFAEAESADHEPSADHAPTGMERLFSVAEESSSDEKPLPDEPEMVIPTVSNEEFAAPPEPPAPPERSWTADPVDVTEEDKRLFGPEPPDWQGLVNLVQEGDQQGQFPAVSSAAPPPPAEPSATSNPPETPEPPSRKMPKEPEREPSAESPALAEAKEAPQKAVPSPPAKAEPAVPNDTISLMVPQIAPLDYATVEQIVRETIEEIMPQIVDRISQATGMQFPKKESPTD